MALAKPEVPGYRKSNIEVPETLENFVKMINSDNKAVQFEGTLGIRKLLSVESNALTKDVLEPSIIKRVIEFMSWTDEPLFQIESTWIITNICAGTSEDVENVINLGVFDLIFDMLGSDSVRVVEQATWAIGNISGDVQEFKVFCFDKKIMDKLIEAMEIYPQSTELTKNVVWIMSNLVQLKPLTGKFWEDFKKGLPIVKQVFADGQKIDAFVHALKVVSYLIETYVQETVDLGCIPALIKELKPTDGQQNQQNVIYVMKTLSNILLKGEEAQFNAIVDIPEFLPHVLDLVAHGNNSIRKDVYLIVCEVVQKRGDMAVFVIENEKFIKAVKKAITTEEKTVSVKICELIDNLTSKGTPEQILKIVMDYGFLGVLLTMLEMDNQYVQKLGLDATLKVLNSGNMLSDYNPYLLYFEEAEMFDKIMLLTSFPDLADTAILILNFLQGGGF